MRNKLFFTRILLLHLKILCLVIELFLKQLFSVNHQNDLLSSPSHDQNVFFLVFRLFFCVLLLSENINFFLEKKNTESGFYFLDMGLDLGIPVFIISGYKTGFQNEPVYYINLQQVSKSPPKTQIQDL